MISYDHILINVCTGNVTDWLIEKGQSLHQPGREDVARRHRDASGCAGWQGSCQLTCSTPRAPTAPRSSLWRLWLGQCWLLQGSFSMFGSDVFGHLVSKFDDRGLLQYSSHQLPQYDSNFPGLVLLSHSDSTRCLLFQGAQLCRLSADARKERDGFSDDSGEINDSPKW